MAFERNLIIVHTPTKQALSDFTSISALIAERAPEIEVFIVNNGNRHSVTRKRAADRPTLVFSPTVIRAFEPIRGKVYQAHRHTKLQEYQRMVAGGVETPASVLVEPGLVLEPESWGLFTVLKPLVGRQGKGVRLWRTRDVRWIDPRSWPRDDPRHGIPLIAQRFVDTGPFTQSHRVMTFLVARYTPTSRAH